MTANARLLRNTATAEEHTLWSRHRHLRPRFTRQHPVGSYIVDFACRSIKLAVERDGSQHLNAVAYDVKPTLFLERLGWRVLRYCNSDVRENADGVAEAIVAAVEHMIGPTHPQPLPSREGL